MPRPWTLALLVIALAVPALAQAPGATPSPAESPEPTAAPLPFPKDTIKGILESELEPAPGGYSYNPQGRRDPFVSLLKPVSAESNRITRPRGLEGFLIQELALKGIVKTPKGFTAMLLGPDAKSYFVQVGQRLFDGTVVAIDAATVTFRQEVTDPLSPVKSREVKKSLYPTEEAK